MVGNLREVYENVQLLNRLAIMTLPRQERATGQGSISMSISPLFVVLDELVYLGQCVGTIFDASLTQPDSRNPIKDPVLRVTSRGQVCQGSFEILNRRFKLSA